MKHPILKILTILISTMSGLIFGWLLLGAFLGKYPSSPQGIKMLANGLLLLSALIGLGIATRANLKALPVRLVLVRLLWLIALNIWSGILAMAIYLGGLEKIKIFLIPVTVILLATVYLLSVALIVGKFAIASALRWIIVGFNLILLTLIPVLFELSSGRGLDEKTTKKQYLSALRNQNFAEFPKIKSALNVRNYFVK